MREFDSPREKNICIEMSDKEHAERLQARLDLNRPLTSITITSKEINEESKKMPSFKTQKEIDNEKSQSKSPKRKLKKIPSKSN